ncbi:transcription-repair coupling factor [Shewanella sp. 202IG2-18]|uniref:transcription-repair coupling factor n=1 Tax=Parashewanella hymeniacidonis TaxID=2807618 RepID=UPI00195FDAF6|nr:transcription-repair coupling factor [Parashewanella hymeniacidonis]MBM7072378.1 transcription-repair coupling factor [Parashewanella hymeniacidonis]
MPAFSVFEPPVLDTSKTNKTQYINAQTQLVRALTLKKITEKHKGTTVIVTNDTPTALNLDAELNYLLANSEHSVALFPDRETLPYDNFSPHQDLVAQRLETLHHLTEKKSKVIIVPISTLLVKLPPQKFITDNVLILSKGDNYHLDSVRKTLTDTGYHAVEQVYEHGEFAVRGSIIDIYPSGSKKPLRIELFDDEVETIRYFDPETQRSETEIESIRMLPAKEFPTDDASIETFRKNYRAIFEKASNAPESIYQQVSKKVMPAGIENYLPLFFEQCETLFDYLNEDSQLLTIGDIESATKKYLLDVEQRFENRNVDIHRPLLKPSELYLLTEQVFSAFKPMPQYQFDAETKSAKYQKAEVDKLPNIAANHKLKQPLANLHKFLDSSDRTLFIAESEGRREALIELLQQIDVKPNRFEHLSDYISATDSVGIIVAPLSHGAIIKDGKKDIAIICETELFGHKISQKRRHDKQKQISSETLIKNLAELKVGQPVVHLEHGVGLYKGLETLDTGGIVAEYLMLEYASGDKLYVPVGSLHFISRYSGGNEENISLNKLGNETWAKAKKKAIERIRDIAAELLDVYAHRQARPGDARKLSHQEYAQFAQGFPFEETVDQETSINAVVTDMCSPISMDRLVCGDVGFGKTEVAMRAVFVAVNDGKQVVVLVPTTLLAQQHYENFKDRFADWPFRIEVLSRFKTPKQQQQILDDLADGKVDVVIGTHKLLNADAQFEQLGLLVIDEEHRFGVRQKEKIKSLRANVDILTLTATPIPRTLNMAMSGMRDLSIIATPPAKRLSVKTFVREYDEATIKEAIQREILRGGQVYFLHNSVETIEKCAADIQELVPEARVVTAHGQMRERDLEKVMSDFYHQRFNVLVCTTIIETGIDVPTANTILIDRADKFGLAQLHQLRGRVGRSHHQAYAYMMTPHHKRLTKDAKKRLEAIEALEDLGAGFLLATQDLEIRGAGELLGDEQSGHITKIGFTLYMELLESAVESLKQGKEPSLEHVVNKHCEMDLRIPALLPEDYIADVNIRLSLYKRIANCESEKAIDEMKVELIDRFGLLPAPAKNLMDVTLLKRKASRIGASKIDIHAKGGSIEFADNHSVNPEFIIGLLQTQPQIYRMDGPNKLRFSLPAESSDDRLNLVKLILKQLSENRLGVSK